MLPRFVGDYRVVRVIGEGGMGIVYEAEDVPLGRRVAVKVLRESAGTGPVALGRFRREALAMRALEDPHIARIFAFHEGPPPFLAMELLSGESLRGRLARHGPLSIVEACLVAVQLLTALASAHGAGIIHRDVKPGNVFLTATSQSALAAKLLDFGVAKLVEGDGPSLTGRDAIVGTASYMAPEQIRGDEVDAKTDVFALGVTLYEMLSGRRPFVATASESAILAILRGGPVAPLRDVPRTLEALVRKAIARSPAARYLTAKEMAVALLPFVPRP